MLDKYYNQDSKDRPFHNVSGLIINPSYLIHVDFGEIGIKKTSAQITKNYKLKDLIGKQIVGLVNLPKKQIANIQSEFLILGAIDGSLENVVIIQPQSITKNGSLIC